MDKEATTALNIGEETSSQSFIPPRTLIELPPHAHRLRRKFRQGCCCLTFLILVNLIVVLFIAKKVSHISHVLSESDETTYMQGGYNSFCSNLCSTLCAPAITPTNGNSDEVNNEEVGVHKTADIQMTQNSCDLNSCIDNCSQYTKTAMKKNYSSENYHWFRHRHHHHHWKNWEGKKDSSEDGDESSENENIAGNVHEHKRRHEEHTPSNDERRPLNDEHRPPN